MVSVASLFELAIKLKVGKLALDQSLAENFELITKSFIELVPVSPSHLLEYQNVPMYTNHRDPFDRLIIATAMVENASIITVDPKFQHYSDLVRIVW